MEGNKMGCDVDSTTHKREQKVCFKVYFATYNDFNLDSFFTYLKKKYALTVLSGEGTNFQSIFIEIRPSDLRELQQAIPESVAVSYELLKPEKC